MLGKVKIRSLEDIKVAQAACVAKEVIKGKGKHSWLSLGSVHEWRALSKRSPFD